MNTLNRAGLLPAGRQDWAETVWAEAHEVPLAGRPGQDDRAGSADAAPRRPGGAVHDRLLYPMRSQATRRTRLLARWRARR
jgi:hypothetical protein